MHTNNKPYMPSGNSYSFKQRDATTDCFWWQGLRGSNPTAEDIDAELVEGPTTYAYGDATVTFIKLKDPLTYKDMSARLSPTAIGRVRLYPVRDPENANGQVMLPGVRHRVFEVVKDFARLGVMKNIAEGADERPHSSLPRKLQGFRRSRDGAPGN